MFVQQNSVQAIRTYFRDRLSGQFSDNEIRIIQKYALMERLCLSEEEYILLSGGQRLSESDLLYFRSVVKRLIAQEPLQYILGKTEFYGLEIYCEPGSLIPRPETEELVDWILQEEKGARRIHDFCTGTGCIALALKAASKESTVSASDFSEKCVSLAQKNARLNSLDVQFVKSDLLQDETIVPADNSCDVIVANPPYIPQAERAEMQPNVLDFEPGEALFVPDDDPLVFYRKIAEIAKRKLKAGGKLYYEVHERFGEETAELVRSLGFKAVELMKDLQGKERMLKAEK